jgi:hypothetical protein
VVAEFYFEQMMRWLEARQREPEEWQRASQFGDTFLYVTAEELAGLGEKTQELVDQYLDRLTNPDLRPAGSRRVSYLHLAFPMTGLPGQPKPGQPAPEPGQPEPGQSVPEPGQ